MTSSPALSIADVARALLGEPDPDNTVDDQWWYGELLVDVSAGRFTSYGGDDVASGDAVDLVRMHKGDAAPAWLQEFTEKRRASRDDEPAGDGGGVSPVQGVGPSDARADAQLPETARKEEPRQNHEAEDSPRPPLPQELAAERELLGLLLLEPDLVLDAMEDMSARDFIAAMHANVYLAVVEAVHNDAKPTVENIVAAMEMDENAHPFPGYTPAQYVAHLMAAAPVLGERDETQVLVRDLAKYICEEATRERGDTPETSLAEAQEAAKPWEPKFGLLMWKDQNQPGSEYEFMIEDLVPEEEPVLIMGETQVGKSFLTGTMAKALAEGKPFMGRRVLRPRGVVYCAYEAGKGYANRMRALTRHEGGPVQDLPLAVLTRPLDLWAAETNVGQLVEEIGNIARHCFNGVPLGAVVIDTHNAAMSGASEIDSEVAGKIRDRYRKIVRDLRCGVWIVSHKNSQGKHRGNEQLYNNIDTAIDVSWKMREDGNNRHHTRMLDDDGREIRFARTLKQREEATRILGEFTLIQVQTGLVNSYGKPRTSCVLGSPARANALGEERKPGEPAVRGGEARLTERDVVFFRALLKAIGEKGALPPASLKLPTSIRAVVKTSDVGAEYRSVTPPNEGEPKEKYDDRIKGYIANSRTKLHNRRAIGILKDEQDGQYLIWPTGRRVVGPGFAWPPAPRLVNDNSGSQQQPDSDPPLAASGGDDDRPF